MASESWVWQGVGFLSVLFCQVPSRHFSFHRQRGSCFHYFVFPLFRGQTWLMYGLSSGHANASIAFKSHFGQIRKKSRIQLIDTSNLEKGWHIEVIWILLSLDKEIPFAREKVALLQFTSVEKMICCTATFRPRVQHSDGRRIGIYQCYNTNNLNMPVSNTMTDVLSPEDPDLIVPGNEEIDVQQIHETSLDRYDSCYISNGKSGEEIANDDEQNIVTCN
ncbi:hypothetical protein OUZ56_020283 [Daphnia magna]|uniref:Uncharacterized protein n=1 Tax=Daphnia magna TaxID=35525 RepID=A0ABQ9ZFK1_9CRUS|nr:hypothetical protein OUZ56_020283 [Daphnia magna]